MRKRAISLLELLAVITIISILAAQIFPLIGQVKKRSKAVSDITNMHQMSSSVLLYETDWDDRAPDILTIVFPYVRSEAIYSSVLDPRPQNPTDPGWNPAPCGVHGDYPRSPYKVSYAYLRASMPEDTFSFDKYDYYYWRQVPNAGMLASPWVGEIKDWMHDPRDDSEDGPVMAGPIYRINMDGSFYSLQQRRYDDCLGGCTYDLFFNRGSSGL